MTCLLIRSMSKMTAKQAFIYGLGVGGLAAGSYQFLANTVFTLLATIISNGMIIATLLGITIGTVEGFRRWPPGHTVIKGFIYGIGIGSSWILLLIIGVRFP